MGLNITASATRYDVVTAPQTVKFKALYCGDGGDVAVRAKPGGAVITFSATIAGTILPIAGEVVESGTGLIWLDW